MEKRLRAHVWEDWCCKTVCSTCVLKTILGLKLPLLSSQTKKTACGWRAEKASAPRGRCSAFILFILDMIQTSSPGSVWARRPASAARCSPPPARCSPAAGEPRGTCTPWCRHAADSSGAPPSGCSVGPSEVDRGRQREKRKSCQRPVSQSCLMEWGRDGDWLDIVLLVQLFVSRCFSDTLNLAR